MSKKVWSKKLRRNDDICTFNSGVVLGRGLCNDARISYSNQEIEIYTLQWNGYKDYRGTITRGCLFGPGILTQMSNMTLKFIIK